MDTGQADMGNQQGNRQERRQGNRATGVATGWRGWPGKVTGVAWQSDRGSDRVTGVVAGWQGRPGKVGQNEQKSSYSSTPRITGKHEKFLKNAKNKILLKIKRILKTQRNTG